MRLWKQPLVVLLLMIPALAQAMNFSGKGYAEARQQARLTSTPERSPGQRYEALLEGQIASGNVRFDGVFLGRYRNRYDRAEESVRDELRSEAQLREYYVTWSGDVFDIRLGRQQQAWGRADYFRVVDVLNPLDLREFLLPYIDNYSLGREPRMMLLGDYFGQHWEHQLMIAPQRNATKLAPFGSDFAMESMPAALPPEYKEGNGVDIGWRGTLFWQGNDVALYAFQGYHSDAMLNRRAGDWMREQPRRDFIGGSLARPAGDWVIRSDVAHYWQEGRQISTGITNSQRSTALLGLDRNKNDWNLNVQMSATYWHDNAEQNENEWEASLALDKNAYQQRLNSGIIWLINHKQFTSHIGRVQVRYDMNPHWKIMLSAVVFDGRQRTVFGQFDQQDRVMLSLRRDFSW